METQHKYLLRAVGALGALSILALFGAGGCAMHHAFGSTFASGVAAPAIQGSGKRASTNRNVASFKKIVLAGSGKLNVKVGGAQSLSLSIDDNILPLITTEVKDGTLTIDSKKNYSTSLDLTVTATVPNLEAVDLEGSGAAVVRGVKGKSFAAEVSGSGSVEVDGAVDTASMSISGSGHAKMQALKARTVSADISGSGKAEIYATDTINADISGSGSISYGGNPKNVQKSISGSGSVKPM